jgi:hypothetical protein
MLVASQTFFPKKNSNAIRNIVEVYKFFSKIKCGMQTLFPVNVTISYKPRTFRSRKYALGQHFSEKYQFWPTVWNTIYTLVRFEN